MMKVLLVGGGDLAKQICHYIDNYDKDAEVAGFVDDTMTVGELNFNKICLGKLDDIDALYRGGSFDLLILGIGYKHLQKREYLYNLFSSKIPFYKFIHPTSFIDSSCVIGSGVIIGPNVTLEQNVCIGNNVFIYNSVAVSHDVKVMAHSFIAPSVSIAGFSHIGSCCFVGIGSIVSNNISITDNVIIGAGSLVIKHILKAGVYFGSPIKSIIKNDNIQ